MPQKKSLSVMLVDAQCFPADYCYIILFAPCFGDTSIWRMRYLTRDFLIKNRWTTVNKRQGLSASRPTAPKQSYVKLPFCDWNEFNDIPLERSDIQDVDAGCNIKLLLSVETWKNVECKRRNLIEFHCLRFLEKTLRGYSLMKQVRGS